MGGVVWGGYSSSLRKRYPDLDVKMTEGTGGKGQAGACIEVNVQGLVTRTLKVHILTSSAGGKEEKVKMIRDYSLEGGGDITPKR